ncbi:glycosyltransferase family 2 protein [Winogradskyella schleiferi]|uniref:glycosyltransferase family 2 protein n=1 Tax=Winogradskyella schleiferi TaxID=2686078 RepID=UPI0015BB213D|nr:glycosyltransferase family 2 protein [Winogradskyella schleiferi]
MGLNVNKHNVLVSVLMTVYNREKYIAEAIESVLNSTYQNWELIIVDDQSKDNSVTIAKSYQAKDSRIKVYVNEKNLGDYPNRNQAAAYAKGKYLKYVDADDKIYPHGLELLVYYMEQFPEAGYGLCSLPQDKLQQFPFQLSTEQAYQRHYFQQPLFHKAPLSAIIKTAAFNSIGGFTGKQHLGDFEMWHLLSQEFPVVLMPHGIAWYREHDDQQMNANRTDPFVPFKYLLIADVLLIAENCPLNKVDRQKALEKNNRKKSNAIISAIKHHSIKKALQMQKKSGLSFYSVLKNKFIK